MQIGTTLRDLVRHMEWADATMWSAVRTLRSTDDARLGQLLNHLHLTQRAFIDVWTGKEFDRSMFHERTVAEAEELARQCHRDAAAFMATLDENTLDRVTNLPWAERFAKGANPTTLGDTIVQITSHSTYHRGQANTRIRELGAEPPLVDYIAWLWLGRPAPRW
jgi:uncharacterized damage-inducible protein DinB